MATGDRKERDTKVEFVSEVLIANNWLKCAIHELGYASSYVNPVLHSSGTCAKVTITPR